MQFRLAYDLNVLRGRLFSDPAVIRWLSQFSVLRRFGKMAEAFGQSLRTLIDDADDPEIPLETVCRLHEENRGESFPYRLMDRPWMLPVTSFLAECRRLSRMLCEEGICTASRKFLDALGVHVVSHAEKRASNLFRGNGPMLLVGEHPSVLGFDFFSVAASLSEVSGSLRDVFFLGWLMVQGIIPGLSEWMFPITVTQGEFSGEKSEERFGPFKNWVQTCAPNISRYRSARFNLASLNRLVKAWTAGKRIVIFPDGGPYQVNQWRSGLGRVIRSASEITPKKALRRLNIVFFKVEGADDRLILNPPILSRFNLIRLLNRPRDMEVIVRYGVPFALVTLLDKIGRMKSNAISAFLQEEYREWSLAAAGRI